MLTVQEVQERSPYRHKLDITRYASIMAEQPDRDKVSEKYQFLGAKQIIPLFADLNFYPFVISESRAVKEGNNAFTKHAITFMNPDMEKSLSPRVGEVFPTVKMYGSHDGTMAWQGFLEAWRVWCKNGCATPTTLAGGKAKHIGEQFYAIVAEIINSMMAQIPHLQRKITDWSNITMHQDEKVALAEAAIELRYDKESGVYVDPREMLRTRRPQDRADDLWTTYSVVQENLIKGGVRAYRQADNGRYRLNNGTRVRKQGVKGITSVTEDKRLNQALWTLTETMENLKKGRAVA